MAAYLIAQVTVDDPEVYRGYTARSPEIIAKHGGRFLARGGTTEVLEGSADNRRIVIVEFPSMEAARAFYNSDEYQQAKAIRAPASTAQFVIIQGID